MAPGSSIKRVVRSYAPLDLPTGESYIVLEDGSTWHVYPFGRPCAGTGDSAGWTSGGLHWEADE